MKATKKAARKLGLRYRDYLRHANTPETDQAARAKRLTNVAPGPWATPQAERLKRAAAYERKEGARRAVKSVIRFARDVTRTTAPQAAQ